MDEASSAKRRRDALQRRVRALRPVRAEALATLVAPQVLLVLVHGVASLLLRRAPLLLPALHPVEPWSVLVAARTDVLPFVVVAVPWGTPHNPRRLVRPQVDATGSTAQPQPGPLPASHSRRPAAARGPTRVTRGAPASDLRRARSRSSWPMPGVIGHSRSVRSALQRRTRHGHREPGADRVPYECAASHLRGPLFPGRRGQRCDDRVAVDGLVLEELFDKAVQGRPV